jgi:hypothetical protein
VGPLSQQIDDAPAVRIGERGERTVEALSTHSSGLNLRPLAFSISSLDTCLTGCEKVQ